MFDEQLEHVMEVLKLRRIWAVNIGENFQVLRRPQGLGVLPSGFSCSALRV